ncbi:MAG: hypothetical protein HY719_03325 [Planctomycetes bacterium]|nr:hypothetical protein [Planctomycetota bacterium]
MTARSIPPPASLINEGAASGRRRSTATLAAAALFLHLALCLMAPGADAGATGEPATAAASTAATGSPATTRIDDRPTPASPLSPWRVARALAAKVAPAPVADRAASALLSAAGVLLVVATAFGFSRRAGTFALVLAPLCPMLVLWGRQPTDDTALFFCAAGAFLSFERLMGGARAVPWAVALAGFHLLAGGGTLLLLAGQTAAAAVAFARERIPAGRKGWSSGAGAALVVVAFLAIQAGSAWRRAPAGAAMDVLFPHGRTPPAEFAVADGVLGLAARFVEFLWWLAFGPTLARALWDRPWQAAFTALFGAVVLALVALSCAAWRREQGARIGRALAQIAAPALAWAIVGLPGERGAVVALPAALALLAFAVRAAWPEKRLAVGYVLLFTVWSVSLVTLPRAGPTLERRAILAPWWNVAGPDQPSADPPAAAGAPPSPAAAAEPR